ncbi:Mlo-related protein [Prunus yedoensis var. nudiflora]|uniref:MLO-like protein n=1 Tax=Prunus yedoensis var. nudiflora TaxID=2094558 RepID=A0A314Y9B5_PRUYE|nr:Mlo-related protein [Prunus yedoensis var. nudiflora]
MAASTSGRSLEQTPTWAVAVVCFVLVLISIIIEHLIELVAKWLKNKHKRALYEALEKVKSEKLGSTWHPCGKKQEAKKNEEEHDEETPSRRLLSLFNQSDVGARRVLAAAGTDKCAPKVCFFRQFVRSVPKVDYLTLRHGFIMIILLVGTKLQVIITKMGLRIQERGEVVKGSPVVQPGDDLFWFNRPRLILYLINFVLFQNAFQLAFFAWSWYEFSLKSCFHEHTEDIIIRVSMGILIQILCSYVTLPLYALVTQMGSTMKPTIFNERVAAALRNWHHTARKHIRHNKGSVTPMSSRPATPSHHMSPIHLLRNYRSEVDSFYNSPRRSNFEGERWDTESPSSSHRLHVDGTSSSHRHQIELGNVEHERDVDVNEPNSVHAAPTTTTTNQPDRTQHEINMGQTKDFSFDKRQSI